MSLFGFLFGNKEKIDFKTLIQNGAIIVDVRSPAEYKSDHFKGSMNIPLDQISQKVNEIKAYNKPIITCCRSGIRSSQAKSILQQNGIEVYNVGSWERLNTLYV